jgi:hypothetical protein
MTYPSLDFFGLADGAFAGARWSTASRVVAIGAALVILGTIGGARAQFDNSLWIGTDNTSNLMVLNTDRTGAILRQVGPVEATGFAIDLPGNRIYFGTSIGGVTRRNLTTLAAGSSFSAIGTEDMTFDGQYILRAGTAGPAASPVIKRIDPVLQTVSGQFTVPFDALGVAWDGSGFWVGQFTINGLVERFDTAGNPTGQSFHTSGNFVNGGLAYDSSDNTLFIGSFARVYHYTITGTELGSFMVPNARFVDGLEFQGVPLLGDYNQNGVVDAADYVVWRKSQGTTNILPNDLIGGTIGTAQYDQWRSHFGQTAGSGAALLSAESLSAAVPEPASALMLLMGGLVMCSRYRAAAS